MSPQRTCSGKCRVILALGFLLSFANGEPLTAPVSARGETESGNILVHSWYPTECCMDIDCQPVSDSGIVASDLGWYVRESGETIPFSDPRVKTSPDLEFHRCLEKFWEPRSTTRCLFVPPGPGA